MNPFEMVVAIIFIVTIGRVLQSRFKHRDTTAIEPAYDPDAARLKDDVRQLKERIQVLERVITDNHASSDLDREIERLRDRS